jgi:hypothetical protein
MNIKDCPEVIQEVYSEYVREPNPDRLHLLADLCERFDVDLAQILILATKDIASH